MLKMGLGPRLTILCAGNPMLSSTVQFIRCIHVMELESVVRQEFELFLREHTPEACLSNIDDVILGYVVDILSTLGEDDCSFDVDQFSEMISAYIPEFANIDSSILCEWVFQLASKQQHGAYPSNAATCDSKTNDIHVHVSDNSKAVNSDLMKSRDTQVGKDPQGPDDSLKGLVSEESGLKPERNDCDDEAISTGESSACNEPVKQVETEQKPDAHVDSDQVEFLAEMFPEMSRDQLHRALHCCRGDMEEAIQLLLDQGEDSGLPGGVASSGTAPAVGSHGNPHGKKPPRSKEDGVNTQLKDFVLSRYAFVDTQEDEKLHRPCMPKNEPKKMVRYRENQVVSTKGERFSMLTKKDLEGEDMKKTYVNLKPLRKYRFH